MNLRKVVFPDDSKSIEKDITNMKSKIQLAAKQITKELSEYGLEEMQKIYNDYPLKGNEPSVFYMEGTDTEKALFMQGPQAIYDEFGTGTLGEMSPHPIKKDFDLDDYNSHIVPHGTIRYATQKDVDNARENGDYIPLGGLFWTYVDSTGKKRYTQGTPAQQEVYDSINKTYEKSPEVIKRIMKEIVFND